MEDTSAILRRVEATMVACIDISTHALEYGIIDQLHGACFVALEYLKLPAISNLSAHSRKGELLISQLELVLAKISDPEPEK